MGSIVKQWVLEKIHLQRPRPGPYEISAQSDLARKIIESADSNGSYKRFVPEDSLSSNPTSDSEVQSSRAIPGGRIFAVTYVVIEPHFVDGISNYLKMTFHDFDELGRAFRLKADYNSIG